MTNHLAAEFESALQTMHEALLALPAEPADVPWRSGGWTRKQILGHLLDSAANNRQRFVRAAIDGSYTGPKYQQQAWVNAHGYADQSWQTLLLWWQTEHRILSAAVSRIAEERLHAPCVVGDDAPVDLAFLIKDYLRHQRHHPAQMQPTQA